VVYFSRFGILCQEKYGNPAILVTLLRPLLLPVSFLHSLCRRCGFKAMPVFAPETSLEFVRGAAGLPDGLFSYQKSRFGYIPERLKMENSGKFRDHLELFFAIWYIL
jgi:hypothetical protein